MRQHGENQLAKANAPSGLKKKYCWFHWQNRKWEFVIELSITSRLCKLSIKSLIYWCLQCMGDFLLFKYHYLHNKNPLKINLYLIKHYSKHPKEQTGTLRNWLKITKKYNSLKRKYISRLHSSSGIFETKITWILPLKHKYTLRKFSLTTLAS